MVLVTRGLPPLNAIRREEALPDGRRSGGDEGLGSRLSSTMVTLTKNLSALRG